MQKLKSNLPGIKFFVGFAALSLSALACGALLSDSSPTPTFPPLPTAVPSTVSTDVEPPPQPDTGDPTPTSESFTLPSDLGEDMMIVGANHIQEGVEASDWNSDPPTSGEHYGQWAPAGFYDDVIADGYLVHNMEHGYVIVYYSCAAIDMDCEAFKAAVEAAMAAAGNDPNTNTIKIVAVPRLTMDNPITYASWGHLYKAETFSTEELVLYVQLYRSNENYAPEWSLP